jgi:hypothetical protein
MTPTKRHLLVEKTRHDIMKPSYALKAEIVTPIQLKDAKTSL